MGEAEVAEREHLLDGLKQETKRRTDELTTLQCREPQASQSAHDSQAAHEHDDSQAADATAEDALVLKAQIMMQISQAQPDGADAATVEGCTTDEERAALQTELAEAINLLEHFQQQVVEQVSTDPTPQGA